MFIFTEQCSVGKNVSLFVVAVAVVVEQRKEKYIYK